MLHDDIINPLINDFIDDVTGLGLEYFNSAATARLNDFVTYLSSLIIDRDFAFYPLRKDQNIGRGNLALGIGLMASGAPMRFPGVAQWTESGIVFGSRTPRAPFIPSYETVGIIDFKPSSGIHFRADDFSIFYFLKHLRQQEFSSTLYRGAGGLAPYFICDDSPDWFQVIAPEFSNDRLRPQGTTYIYDEIFGEDKKGLKMDWSAKDSEKYYGPQAVSFYDPEKDRPARFYCLNVNGNFNNYSMRFIYGRDPTLLSGSFPSPYSAIVNQNGDIIYEFPRRIVLGAGASNLSSKFYNTDGLDHISPGILITKGDYGYLSEQIAAQMLEGIGIVYQEEPQVNIIPTERASGCDIKIFKIDYFETFPNLYNKYPKEFLSLFGTIDSIILEDYGKFGFSFSSIICGHLGCYGGWVGFSPKELTDVRATAAPDTYKTGILETGTYGSLQLGEFANLGIVGFISGFIDEVGNFSGFAPKTLSGYSGFYYEGESVVFPPYKYIATEKIIGYISGMLVDGEFIPFNPFQNNYSSGYFITGTQANFTEPKIIQKPISGFQFGTLDQFSNNWSGFPSNNKLSSSGYILDNEFKEFLPIKNINKEAVTGFWFGVLESEDLNTFSGFENEFDLSGILTTLDTGLFLFTDEGKIFFPSGGNFNSFDNIEGFDPDIGYEFSGFFFDISGFYSSDMDMLQYPKTGMMTGHIGYKNFIEYSGEFSGAESITGFDDDLGLTYDGFFAGDTFFSGIEFDPFNNQFLNYGSGYLIGNIGTINVLEYNSVPSFDDRDGFTTEYGYAFTGFSFPEGTGFSGSDGIGTLTGYIGSRNYLDYTGQYSGFTGLLDNYNRHLSRFIFANFEFTRGSGFVGARPGNGLLTGVISTGYVKGDANFFDGAPYTGLYMTGLSGIEINRSGEAYINPTGGLEFSLSEISGTILTGSEDFKYIPGTLSGFFFDTGYTGFNPETDSGFYDIRSGSYISGGIESGIYITGVIHIGSGQQNELDFGFRYESGNISGEIISLEYNNATPNIFDITDIENLIVQQDEILSIEYTEQNVDYGFSIHTGNISGGITSIRSFSTLINSATGIESGSYTVSGLYGISTTFPSIFFNSGNYNVSGKTLDVFTLFPPIASISYINDVTITTMPYTGYFTGINLQTLGIPTVDNWYWNMSGDAAPEFNQKDISFVYTQTGTYTFSLTATNASGSSTANGTIIIRSGITAAEIDPLSDYVTLLLFGNN